MLGANESHGSVPWCWSDQYDLSVHIAGPFDEGYTVARRDLGEGAEGASILFFLAPDGRLVAPSGIDRGNSVARDVRLAQVLIAKRVRPDPATRRPST